MQIPTIRRGFLFLSLLLFGTLTAQHLWADEPVRRVQEELRRRNLFFGEVDGKITPALVAAVRVYQMHKGFSPTGKIDETTARSLNVETGQPNAGEAEEKWPNVPVLKSDTARELSPEKQAALEQAAVANINATPGPDIPAEGPGSAQNLNPQQVTKFVQDYLRDAETNELAPQLRYYTFPVDYFSHGRVDEKFVARDNLAYMRRWPERRYQLSGPLKFAAGPREGETMVEFPITFRVHGEKREAAGKTRNFWTLKPGETGLKISAIREEHVRE
jgi:hypothetical protein